MSSTTSCDKRELGNEAVWTLSTAKPGNGVEQLRDDSAETYWQSDGPQPHLVTIQFHKKMKLKELAIYCDYKHDESYTPSKISIRAGTHFHDLQEIDEIELEEPQGWVFIPLAVPSTKADADSSNETEKQCIRAYIVQIAILQNHQNGRDSHIRQIKIYGPRESTFGSLPLTSQEMELYATVR